MATYLGRFLILAKLASEWSAANPVLMNGELGVSDPGSATPILKVGDGSRPWSALPPISGAGGGGSSPDYIVGTTDTLPPGSFATVTIDNAVSPPTISFGIPRGAVGPPNTLAIGTTTTGAPGSPASATITGAAPNQTLNLVIPQGPIGPQGIDGSDGGPGPVGPANVLTIGVVTTAPAGGAAAASITGTTPAQVLNLTIPTGAQGPQGPIGPAGPGGSSSLADPSALVGLVAIPGTSTFGMRADGAPALSTAIAPLWTGPHMFAGVTSNHITNGVGIGFESAVPALTFGQAGAALDAKAWDMTFDGAQFNIRAINDALNQARNVIVADRTGFVITNIGFGNATNNPTFRFLGTGLTTFGGNVAGVGGSWSGQHDFSATGNAANAAIRIMAATPSIFFNETGAPADHQFWDMGAGGTNFVFRSINNATTVVRNILAVRRSGVTVTALEFGNATDNPTYTFLGTGKTTHGGPVAINATAESLALVSIGANNACYTGYYGSGAAGARTGYLGFAGDTVFRIVNEVGALVHSPNSIQADAGFVSDSGVRDSSGSRGIIPNYTAHPLFYGSAFVTGTKNSFAGLGINDALQSFYMSNGTDCGIYMQTDGKWLLRRAAGAIADSSYAFQAPSFTTTSSRAIKRETGTPARASTILSRLRPLLYRLLDGDDREQLGLIAEEVHEVCPQLSDGKTVAYDRLAILLLAAWQSEHAT